MTTLENFKQVAGAYGFAKPNLFEVRLTSPSVNSIMPPDVMTLYCYATTIPALNIMTQTIREDDIPFEVPYGMSFEPVTLTFYVDLTHRVRALFENWHQNIYNNNTKTFQYWEQFVKSIEIVPLFRQAPTFVPAYIVTIEQAYPKSIGPLTYQQDANDTFLTMDVTFTYTVYKSEVGGTSVGDINNAIQSIFNDAGIINPIQSLISSTPAQIASSVYAETRNILNTLNLGSYATPVDRALAQASFTLQAVNQARSTINKVAGSVGNIYNTLFT